MVIAPTTAPSMMPTRGTTIDERTATRRSTARKIAVPANANAVAATILSIGGAWGNRMSIASSPSPAHWLVPAVVGSTNRFCVMSCMITPEMLIAVAAKIRASVRGTREMKNISAAAGSVKRLPSEMS